MSNRGRTKFIVALIGIVLIVIAAVQNSQSIDLKFLFWQARVDGLLLFLCLFALGFIVGMAFSRRGGSDRD